MMNVLKLMLFLTLCLLLIGAAKDFSPKAYRELHLVRERPRLIPTSLAVVCTEVTPDMIEGTKEAYGPHHYSQVRNYVSGDLVEQMKRSIDEPLQYLTGSVIVKEKLRHTSVGYEVIGVGGMIRREKGSSPESGDWEFFYFEDDKVHLGSLTSCVNCHKNAVTGDFVFGEFKDFYSTR